MSVIDASFYLNLITSEHAIKPKFKEWVEVLLTPFIDCINLNDDIKKAFDLNTAVGVQLDTLGKILVQSRQMSFQPTDGSSPILNDYYYRIVLKSKVIKNQWKGTIHNFYEYWNVLFEGQPLNIYLIDNQQMEPAIVVWSSQVTQMIQDFLAHDLIVPKPAGLGLTVRRVDNEGIFGFYGSEFTGFDTGTFWLPN